MGRKLTPLRGETDEREATDFLSSSIVALREFSAADGEQEERRPVSPERQRYLKLQGEYVGHLPRLTPLQKDRVKALRAKEGIEVAVALVRKLANR